MNVGSLFSGIGGLDLGLERAGMHVKWQCEIDSYCRAVLAHHWPDVPCYEDIREVRGLPVGSVRSGSELFATPVDLICGGFPCQPISQAAARSERGEGWLWPEFARVIGELSPRWVIIENVEALRYANRGLSEVLWDLAELGFDAEWRAVRASWFGAAHHRARLWLVANSYGDGESACAFDDETPWLSEPIETVPGWGAVPDLRMADGIPDRVLRRQRLGNAVVPAVAEWVGRCVMRAEARRLGKAA